MVDATLAKKAYPLTRPVLFYGLFVIVTANALAGQVLRTSQAEGWISSFLQLGGYSAIIWIACAAGLALISTDDPSADDALHRADGWVAAVILLLAILPMSTASAAGLTLLAFWAIFSTARGGGIHRAGIVFLAVSVSLLWGRIFLAIASRPILDIDAMVSGWLVGSHGTGNHIAFTDGSGYFVVAPGCSSLHNISLALVLWATVTQYYRIAINARALLVALLAVAAAFGVNIIRLASLAHFPAHFDELHVGWGLPLFGWMSLIAIVAVVIGGFRKQILA